MISVRFHNDCPMQWRRPMWKWQTTMNIHNIHPCARRILPAYRLCVGLYCVVYLMSLLCWLLVLIRTRYLFYMTYIVHCAIPHYHYRYVSNIISNIDPLFVARHRVAIECMMTISMPVRCANSLNPPSHCQCMFNLLSSLLCLTSDWFCCMMSSCHCRLIFLDAYRWKRDCFWFAATTFSNVPWTVQTNLQRRSVL